MKNRLAGYFEQGSGENRPKVDFWVVHTDAFRIFVDETTALNILEALDQRWPRIWLRFRNIFGDRVSLRSRDVLAVHQCTTAARELNRRFYAALAAEEPSEEGWEGV